MASGNAYGFSNISALTLVSVWHRSGEVVFLSRDRLLVVTDIIAFDAVALPSLVRIW